MTRSPRLLAIFVVLMAPFAVHAQGPAENKPVSELTPIRAGRLPGDGLLFNGWGLTPAGEQLRVSDMPLKMVVTPDKKRLIVVSAGFNDQGLTVIDLADRKVVQFLPLPEVFNGLCFDKDGRRILVSSGDKGFVYGF